MIKAIALVNWGWNSKGSKQKEVEQLYWSLLTFTCVREGFHSIDFTLSFRSLSSGLDSGNIEFAIHDGMGYCYRSFLAGVDLKTVQKDMIKYKHGIASLNHHGNTYILDLYRQVVENLLSEDADLEPGVSKWALWRRRDVGGASARTRFCRFPLIFEIIYGLHVWAGRASAGVSQTAQKEFKAGIGTYNGTVFYFYRSLILMRAIRKRQTKESKRWFMVKNLKRFKKWPRDAANQASLPSSERRVDAHVGA